MRPWRTSHAHPGARDLSPEYQTVIAGGYDEEALMQQVLEAPKADENKFFPSYIDAIALTSMVAEHLTSLPPPPPLPSHAWPVADYKGQEVPPSPGVPRRHGHPYRVFINPQPQPQSEVIVDLVYNDEQ
jgi:hypothetical protein